MRGQWYFSKVNWSSGPVRRAERSGGHEWVNYREEEDGTIVKGTMYTVPEYAPDWPGDDKAHCGMGHFGFHA